MMLADAYRIRKQSMHAQSIDEQTQKTIDLSLSKVKSRQGRFSDVSFPDDLPVVSYFDEIIQALTHHSVIVIAGETGSGKTTQLPKLLLSKGYGARGLIGHTQPRRMAARSVAMRISAELNVECGAEVGFAVRFQEHVNENTFLKVMTDGILLSEIVRYRLLTQYEVIIIDEAHERSLNIDFLLGYLKRLLPKRPELKVIITSATLDCQRLSAFFDHGPIITIPGRLYPVEVRYWQPEFFPSMSSESFYEMTSSSLEDKVLYVVNEIQKINREKKNSGACDTLVFLSSEKEIREVSHRLRQTFHHQFEILPLYARLPQKEQDKIFKVSFRPRIILSTNIAETSLTVPNIGYVIDAGQMRISRYSARSKIQRLPIESISKASAQQRTGRSGRIAPGICFRLYTEDDFLKRPEFTEPEILRTHLASVILNLKSLNLGDCESFPFLDRPEERYFRDGYALLQMIGALDSQQKLTDRGREIARIPVDPRLARILCAFQQSNALTEGLIIVSALSVQDPRERPPEKAQDADQKQQGWKNKKSDFIAYLNVWGAIETARQEKTRAEFEKWCAQHYLSWMKIKEWREIHWQLKVLCEQLSWKENTVPATYEEIHRALLTGFIDQVAEKDIEQGYYRGTRGRKIYIHPQSSLFKGKAAWIMMFDIVETSKVYARVCAEVDPLWVSHMGRHLLSFSYSDPFYDANTLSVKAFEQGALFGLVLYRKKKVRLSEFNAPLARKVFVDQALAGGEITADFPFVSHNLALIQEVILCENKRRRRDLLVSNEYLADWYERHLPKEIIDGVHLKKYAEEKKHDAKHAQFLKFQFDDLLLKPLDENEQEKYPDFLMCSQVRFSLHYRFEYGEPKDGVTMVVPLDQLSLLNEAQLSWLIPGWIEEKCVSIARNLPKEIRKYCQPLSEYISGFLERCHQKTSLSLGDAFKKDLYEQKRINLLLEDWQDAEKDIHTYLHFHFSVVNEQDEVLASGQDLTALHQTLVGHHRKVLSSIKVQSASALDQTLKPSKGYFADLPVETAVSKGHQTVSAFVGLGQTAEKPLSLHDIIQVKLFATLEEAEDSFRRLLPVMMVHELPDLNRSLKKSLTPLFKQMALLGVWASNDEMTDEYFIAVAKQVYTDLNAPIIRTQSEFNHLIQKSRALYLLSGETIRTVLQQIIEKRTAIYFQLKTRDKPVFQSAVVHIRLMLSRIFIPHFLYQREVSFLKRLPIYLAAFLMRIEKMGEKWEKDQENQKQIEKYFLLLSRAQEQSVLSALDIQEFESMLYEWWVSLFAPQIKTAFSISEKKITQWLISRKMSI